MATSKKTTRASSPPAAKKKPAASGRRPMSRRNEGGGAALETTDIEAIQGKAIDVAAAQMPSNPLKPFEAGMDNALEPRTGEPVDIGDRALTAGGVLSPASLESMFRPHVRVEGSSFVSYGYGWMVGHDSSRQDASHGGAINGFSACVRRSAGEDLFVVVLSNVEEWNACGSAAALERAAIP